MSAEDMQELSDEKHLFDFNPYEFTEMAVWHKGASINLHDRPWLDSIYETPVAYDAEGEMRRKMLLLFGRQCEKSTSIGNILIALSNLIPYLRSLYVTASNQQMREFSDERLRAVIADSPMLRELSGKLTTGHKQIQNVQTKRWLNQAKIILRSVYRNADRVRGISADLLGLDEIQDVYTDSIPVIEETLFACQLDDGPISIYSGTPKTFDNPAEFYWSRWSTMNEWMTRCGGCGKWTIIEEKHIKKDGLYCDKCSHWLDPSDRDKAMWVRTGRSNQTWEGFRLPQPIAIYAHKANRKIFDLKWKGLLDKQRRYPRPKFSNEVMARSYDAGTKPVTLEEVRRCCVSDLNIVYTPDKKVQQTQTWAGIDWGSGDGSYTILSIWGYDRDGRFQLFYARRYEGVESDPEVALKHIIQMCKLYKVNRIGSDWGFGFESNSKLRKVFGVRRVMLYFHAGKQSQMVKIDKHGDKWTTHRSRVLQMCFNLIKRGPKSGGVVFPNWEQSETFMNDILSVYTEFSEARREIIFNHPRDVPDDFLHTMCYALLASMFDHPRRDLLL